MSRADRARKLLRIPSPAVSFKVFPEGKRGYFFWIAVFRTSQELSWYHRMERPKSRDHQVYGFTQASLPHQNCIGVISFYFNSMTDLTVSHELFHAAMHWASMRRFRPHRVCGWGSPIHERVAEAHGAMVSQTWRQYVQFGHQRSECWGFEKSPILD